MKPITEELLRKYLGPDVRMRRGWRGAWKVNDPATGMKGRIGPKGIDVTVKHADPKIESYEPFGRLSAHLFCKHEHDPEFIEFLGLHIAKACYLEEKWKLRKLWSPFLAKAEKTITKGRLVWHFDELGLKEIRRKLFGGFILMMNSGRRIDVNRANLDFTKSPCELLPGEPEHYVGTLKLECFQIAQDVWGGITFPTLTGQALLDALAMAEECGFTAKDERARIAKFFGWDAKVKWLWCNGFRIDMPDGSSVHISGGVQEVNGGADLYVRALRLGHEILEGKPFIVSGSQENVLAGIAHAEQLGIEVIPELYPKRIHEAIGMGTAIVRTASRAPR